MGKSPGKWIKTLLFGKKSSKSNAPPTRDQKLGNERVVSITSKPSEPDVPPLVSHPIPTIASRNEQVDTREAIDSPNNNGVSILHGGQDQNSHESTLQDALYDPEKEKAVIKTQAAFRGYLARRAFKALKGIIRLQALIRAHLVRRQAVATLNCVLGIVKLQAVVRGRKVRLSDTGLEVQKICSIMTPLKGQLVEPVGVSKLICLAALTSNVFVRKLLASSPTVMPLRLRYDPVEPNSVPNWLERWSASHRWEPVLQPKKVTDTKPLRKQCSGPPVEPESGRPKRSVRRVPAANLDGNSVQSTSELEKPKRNLRKIISHLAEPMHEDAPNEFEKVKSNLRKVHNPILVNSVQSSAETEKPRQSLEKVSSSHDVTECGLSNSVEKMKKETTLIEHGLSSSGERMKKETFLTERRTSNSGEKVKTDTAILMVTKLPEVETNPDVLEINEELDLSCANEVVVELDPLMASCGKDENIPETNGDFNHKEELTSNDNQISNKKASTPAKQEHAENGTQHSPTVPSYMAATKSAKAKLRLQGSPSLGQDGTPKSSNNRRHSLPSPTNGKISSQSPRTQRLVNSGGKGGNKNDKSLVSSKDGNAKVAPEWKR